MKEKSNRSLAAIGLAAVALIISACGPPPVNSDPVVVIQEFYDAINIADVEAAMVLVSDNAVFLTAHGDGIGTEQVRELIQFLVDSGYQYELRDFHVEGDTVTWMYDVSSEMRHFEDINAVAVVQEGRILTFADLL